jgi:hypothetical protein
MQPILLLPQPPIIEQRRIHPVAWHRREWGAIDILHDPPSRLGLGDHPFKLGNQICRDPVASMSYHSDQSAERLAGRAADHAVEGAGRGMEFFNVSAPEQIRTPHETESLLLKCTVEHPDSREDG